MEKTHVLVRFGIYGDCFQPSIVTRLLGLEPTQTYLKGEPTLTGRTVRPDTSWNISTGYQESDDINHQLEQIMQHLRGKTEELVEIRDNLGVEMLFMFVVKIENGEVAAMYLEKEFLRFVSAIDARVEFDVYVNS